MNSEKRNYYHWTELHTAAKNGDEDMLVRLIQDGANPDAVTKLNWSPLHLSAKYGHLGCCRKLLNAGASINIPTKLRFFTPFHVAALEGYTEIVQLFLEYGADINVRTAEGWTPLHAAVEHAHLDTVRFLLEQGADPNFAKQATMATFPLHSAARNGRRDVLQLLLDFGANPNVQNKHGKYPKNLANEVGFPTLAELLEIKPESRNLSKKPNANWISNLIRCGDLQRLENWLNEGGAVSYVPKNGMSLLSYAVLNGLPNTVRYLLERGANPNVKHGYFSESILFSLIVSGFLNGNKKYVEIANILLDYGAKLFSSRCDISDPLNVSNMIFRLHIQALPLSLLDRLETAGVTIELALKKHIALRWAAKVGDIAEAEQLLKNEANPNSSPGYGDTNIPLNIAIQENNTEMVRLLVKYGANINKKPGYGDSFLYDAVCNENIEMVKVLVDAGANVNHKSNSGVPIQAALSKGNAEIVDYLVEHGADIESRTNWIQGEQIYTGSTPIFSAVVGGDGELIQKLIDAGADIHVTGNYGNTLLHIAAEKGLMKWVEYFLDNGLDIEAENRNHYRPLHWAAMNKRKEVVQYLMKRGASVNVPPPSVSPVIYAIMLDRIDLLETALEKNRDEINQPSDSYVYNGFPSLPIIVALEYNNRAMVELLVKRGDSLTDSRNFYHSEGACGESALSYVSRKGMKDLLELFLKQDINVNSKASVMPALHCAASTEIAQILLDHGANPYLRSNENRTALECQLHNNEVAALLRQTMSREHLT
ncbi:MAG: ankyrin repeat domain-containing protein [Planctomycetaceae bacterium]|jgi:cytohesin|nr:ankyrin repeat domain-containing protein [Planctomycetaceae bacterium]